MISIIKYGSIFMTFIIMGYIAMKVLSSFSWTNKIGMMRVFRSERFSIPSLLSSIVIFLMIITITTNQEEINAQKEEIKDLKLQLEQTVNLEQTITTTVNNVTKVEKEIVDIKEVIHQLYSGFITEKFKKEDLNKKVKVFENPLYPGGKSVVIFFELESIAEENSVRVSANRGMAPFGSYRVRQNTIALREEIKKEDVLKQEADRYLIRYIPSEEKGEIYTVEGMEFEELEDGRYDIKFHKR